jgi:FkbM family methyltransferase
MLNSTRWKRVLPNLLSKIFGNKPGQDFLDSILKLINYLRGVGAGDIVHLSGERDIVFDLNKVDHKIIVFDVGANVGQFASMVESSLKKSYMLYSFEPSNKSFDALCEKFKFNQNMVLENMALGESFGKTLLFYDHKLSGSASLTKFNPRIKHAEFEYSEEINIIRLDDYVLKENIKYIDLLKIDVEGHELDVLNGAKNTIQKGKISKILFEFGGQGINTRVFFYDLFVFLINNKYKVSRVTPSGYLREVEEYSSSNEIFITTNFLAYKE